MPQLSIELLGPPRVTVDARPISVDTKKAIALLAYLALTDQALTRDTLAPLFWPECDQERARASLRRTLSALRKGLGPFREALQITHDQIGFEHTHAPDIQVDVDRFNSLLVATNGHGHEPAKSCEACLQPLTDAVALCRGDFLAGFSLRDCPAFEDWQRYQAESLRRMLASALERLAGIASSLGKHAEAIAAARRRVNIDPLDEPAHRALMLAYAWADQRAAALQQYRLCVRTLDEELGVAPLPETTQLAELMRENGAFPSPSFGFSAGPPAGTPTPATDGPGVAAGAPPPLVGRASEWQVLLDIYASAIDHGCLIVLGGEPGIGKTRVAETFVAEVRSRGATVVATRCYEGESDLAYGVIVDALRSALRDPRTTQRLQSVPGHWLAEAARLLPELALEWPELPQPLADQAGAGARLAEALRQVLFVLLSGPAPGVLFLDDLQWADEASLELVGHLIRRFHDHAVVVLATWRDEEGPASGHLHRLLAAAGRSGTATRLSLERLGPRHVAELVSTLVPDAEGASELADRLYEQTEGLPLFLIACIEALADGTAALNAMPDGMRELLRARVASVSQTARQLLGTAAIIGHSFEFETLRAASGRAEEEAVTGLDELLARRLVHEVETGGVGAGAGRFDFSHEQLRQVVYQDTSLVRRRLLHRRVAETLRAGSAGASHVEPDPGQIALHYRLAGQDDLAADFYCQAGERARRLHANTEALAHFESALALGYANTALLHEAIGDLQTLGGAYAAAATSYDLAAAHAAPARQVVIERKLGSLFVRQGAWERAESHFEAASSEQPPVDTAERARLLAAWSLAAHRQAQLDRAWALATQALENATRTGDPRALAECHNIAGMLARHRGDLDQAARHLESSLQLAISSADLAARVAALNNLALLCATTGQPERGLERLEDALATCRLLGDHHQEAALLTNAADVLRAVGRTSEAMARVKEAVGILADIGAELGSLQPEIWKLTEW